MLKKRFSESGTARLSKLDWIEAGTQAIGLTGVGSLRIDALCSSLKVTKGSFYWHFTGREDYLRQILAGWEQRETFAIIDQVEDLGGGSEVKLYALFEIANSGRVDFRAEQAIRHWAQEDPDAARIILSADQRRLDYLANLYVDLGVENKRASTLATLMYALILGEATIRRKESRAKRQTRQLNSFNEINRGVIDKTG